MRAPFRNPSRLGCSGVPRTVIFVRTCPCARDPGNAVITMAGGSSLLRGLPTVISHATGLDVRLAEDPLTCVARGTSVYLENLELWKDTMESDEDEL